MKRVASAFKICLYFAYCFSITLYAQDTATTNEVPLLVDDSLNIDKIKNETIADFPKESFFFGLATAPAHVEDGLDDGWLQFAREGKVAAFTNQAIPEQRLRFFTDYKTEIDLAASTGIQIFRMGVDWGRLVPNKPIYKICETSGGIQNTQALERYDEIVNYALSKNMKIMMTLFHHSPPRWFIEAGGWPTRYSQDCFEKFSKDVIDHFADRVAYWITFNEPAVYNMLTYVAGIWPPGFPSADPTEMFSIPGIYKGDFDLANENMAKSNHVIYEYIHKILKLDTKVGIAHNVGWHKANSAWDLPGLYFSKNMLNYNFMDLVINHIDFIGLNYYGAEYVRGLGVGIEANVEYSESGRAIDPYGLYALLKDFNNRYNERLTNRIWELPIPFIITENGLSESSDILRPSYLIEHLLAIKQAMKEGINVLGYVYWTISDNWEWADGYCPKFGLYSVDRANELARTARPNSVKLFTDIVQYGKVTKTQRDVAWNRVLQAQNTGALRTMCRAADGQSALDTPIYRPFVKQDWRFDLSKPSNQVNF